MKELAFFNDYILWMKCKLEASKEGIHINSLIYNKVQDYLIKKYPDKSIKLKKVEDFYLNCHDAATDLNVTPSEFIEGVMKEHIDKVTLVAGHKKTDKKTSFFDLNRDAR